MMNNITRTKGEMIRGDGACLPAAIPMHDKRISVPVLQPSEITRLPAKYVLTLAEISSMPCSLFTTNSTAKCDLGSPLSSFMSVHPCLIERLKDALPGDTIPLSKVNHRDKVSFIGVYDVNFLNICQSYIQHSIILLSLVMYSIHIKKIVVKSKDAHKQCYQTKRQNVRGTQDNRSKAGEGSGLRGGRWTR